MKHATVADVARLEGISPEQAVERAAHLEPTSEDDDDAAGDLAFAEFDIVGVLERAAPLLAAKSGDDALFGGADDGVDDAKKQLSKAERLRLAKQTLKQRLGMALDSTLEGAAEERDGAATRADAGDAALPSGAAAGDVSASAKANLDVDKFVDVDDLVGEEDVAEVKVEANDDAEKKMDASDLTQLSARERNRLKRKMKRGARDAADGVEPAAKRGRKPGSAGASGKNAVDPETAARLAAEAAEEEDEAAEVEAGGWPLARTCEKLAYSLFAPRWEERHGAAAALREVLRTHAASAAVPAPPPRARGVEPDAAAAVSASSSSRVAWNETRIAVAAAASTQSSRAPRSGDAALASVPPAVARPSRSGDARMSCPSVRHTARRTAAIGCAANGKSDGTTSRRADPGPRGGVARVAGSAYSALTRRITGTFEGLVRRSGSSSLPSKVQRPANKGGKSRCVGKCLAAGSSASAAAPRTSSSLSSSAAVAAGSAAGSSRGASASRAASTYRSASSALWRTSHSGRRSSTRMHVTTASTARGGRTPRSPRRCCSRPSMNSSSSGCCWKVWC